MIGFSKRAFLPELMDDATCDEAKLIKTLIQFKGINALFSRYRYILNRYVLARRTDCLSIVDVGAGGGDIMCWLAKECRRRGIVLSALLLDSDPRVVAFAKNACRDFPELEICLGDIKELEKRQRFDYVFANHFLHHFPDDMIPSTIAVMHRAAAYRLIISDIQRAMSAYFLFGAFAATFYHSSFARFDGLLSIRKGFSLEELTYFTEKAGIDTDFRVQRLPPSRVLMIADGPELAAPASRME